jgi:3-isopropylmalate/(R)-2-methylmalate dehydratase large subunit
MEERFGISKGMLKNLPHNVLAAGKLFGRGSSREHAAWAAKLAGFEVIYAQSFGPIFEKNATYIGLLTTTNQSLIRRLHAGEPVKRSEFAVGKDRLSSSIIKHGGLFHYLDSVKDGKIQPPHISPSRRTYPMNILEQRIAGAVGVKSIQHRDTLLLPINMAYSYDVMTSVASDVLHRTYEMICPNIPMEHVFFFEDHFAQSHNPAIPFLWEKQRAFARELGLPETNYFKGRLSDGGGMGICHRVMLGKLDPRSSKITIATDSHTPTIGALPIVALPVGSTLFAAALTSGKIPYTVPSVTRVEFTGSIPDGVSIRDVQLLLASQVTKHVQTSVIEFGGPGFRALSFDQVVALCNMVPEVFNAEVAITECFDAGVAYVSKTFGISETESRNLYGKPEAGAHYQEILSVNLSDISPWIAHPGSPNNSVALSSLSHYPSITKAFLISCTLGLEDLACAAAMLQGKIIHPGVQLVIIPATRAIAENAERRGFMEIFRSAGACISDESVCGPCCGEGLGALLDTDVAMTASNRNFPGRMGSKLGKAYMGSPMMVAIAAVMGKVPTPEEYRIASSDASLIRRDFLSRC